MALITWILLGVVVYVYVGYPALLVFLKAVIRRPVQKGENYAPLSLIIAAFNEESVIAEKIENSLALDYPADSCQIIVVTDGSSDQTPAIARRYEDRGVIVLHSDARRGKSAAINRGVAVATGEIIVFSDANAFYSNDALKNLSANFCDERVGQVSGKKDGARQRVSRCPI